MAELKRKHVILRGKGQPHAGFADVFYIEEPRLQCEFGLRSQGEIQQRVAAGSTDLVLFAFIQMMLGFAGNASKLLGPPKQSGAKGRARAARLRKVLGLASTSILDDRAARNYRALR